MLASDQLDLQGSTGDFFTKAGERHASGWECNLDCIL
jgi:hypothetical protein